MKPVYLISGLGADKRVFEFLDLSEYQINHINWVSPITNESVEHYAKRLLDQITTSKPILIGVSFGGMVAVEISKLIETEKVILISSAKANKDIPLIYKLAGIVGLNQIIPMSLLKSLNNLTYWFFGVETKNERVLLKKIISETDENFLRWSIGTIMNWKNSSYGNNIITIHGSQDRILPNKKTDHVIDGGGHLMIINRASEITHLIKKSIR